MNDNDHCAQLEPVGRVPSVADRPSISVKPVGEPPAPLGRAARADDPRHVAGHLGLCHNCREEYQALLLAFESASATYLSQTRPGGPGIASNW